jgi:C_GCAxxG_C_C family probable redox protein
MSQVDKAVEMFSQGFNCSQSAFCGFAETLGLERETALKLASGFGGGMGAMGGTCGAVTGAFMALGLKFGHTSPQDKAAKQKIYGLVKEFAKRFQASTGSLACRDLLGFEIGTPEGQKLAVERDVHHKICPKFVNAAAEILGEMMG